jgi:hypothetical protein
MWVAVLSLEALSYRTKLSTFDTDQLNGFFAQHGQVMTKEMDTSIFFATTCNMG